MNRLLKIKLFILLDLKTKLLFIESYFFLGWAYLLLKRPFKKIAPLLGEKMKETSLKSNEDNITILKHISDAIRIMSQYTFWDRKCFVKAIAAMKMLERRNIESTLYLGTARDESGQMVAHAWLRSGSLFITGKEGMKMFTVVSQFAKHAAVNEKSRGTK